VAIPYSQDRSDPRSGWYAARRRYAVREHLGRQVLGQGLAHAPRDEPVHRGEVLPEHGLEVLPCRDGPGRLLPAHE